MKSKRLIFPLILLVFLMSGCAERQKADAPKESVSDPQASLSEQKLETDQDRLADVEKVKAMRAEAEMLLRELAEKETLLQVKQAELDSLRSKLDEKERELALREEVAFRTKKAGLWLFAIGVGLIFLSIILFILSRAKGKKSKDESATVENIKADRADAATRVTVKKTAPAKTKKPVKKEEKGEPVKEPEASKETAKKSTRTATKTKEAESKKPAESKKRTRRTATKPRTTAAKTETKESKPAASRTRKKSEPKSDEKKESQESKE